MENAEIAEIVEDAPAEGPAPAPAPVPAPSPTLQEQQEKSTYNFGIPASANSDFYIRTLFQPGLVDTQYNVSTFCKNFSALAQLYI